MLAFVNQLKEVSLVTIGAIVILVLDIVALIDIIGGSGSLQHKLLWALIVLFLPVIGMILYFLIGKNRATDL
jgi:hypothetical protein